MSSGPTERDPSGAAPTPRLPSQNPWQLVAPIAIFLITNRLAGLRWAVVIATIWSVGTVVDRRRKGLALGKFFPVVTGALLLRGAIGAVTGSEAVYFGLGIGAKYVAAAVLAASVLLQQPLARLGAPYVLAISGETQRHRAFHRAMRDATLIGALYYLFSASFDIWLFRRSDTESFVILRTLANWPFGVLMLAAVFLVVSARFKAIDGLDPLPTLVERRLESY